MALRAAAGLLPLDDLVPLLPQTVHLHDLLRRVLKIAVDHDAALALCRSEPRKDRRFFPKVPGKMESADTAGRGKRRDLLPGGVPGAVIHENELTSDCSLRQHAADDRGCFFQYGLLIIDGDNHRQHYSASFAASGSHRISPMPNTSAITSFGQLCGFSVSRYLSPSSAE